MMVQFLPDGERGDVPCECLGKVLCFCTYSGFMCQAQEVLDMDWIWISFEAYLQMRRTFVSD